MVSLFQFVDKSLKRISFQALWPFVLLMITALVLLVIMFFAQPLLGLTPERIEALVLRGAQSPFALVCVITVFILVCFSGIPHLFLIAGTLAVYGLPGGAIYAWIGMMSGAIAMYLLGVWSFRPRLPSPNIVPVKLSVDLIRHHGMTISSLLWLAPAQFFVLANVALGASRVSLSKFLIGTGIASGVKISLIVILSDQLKYLFSMLANKDPANILTIFVSVGLWVGIVLMVRQYVISGPSAPMFDNRN